MRFHTAWGARAATVSLLLHCATSTLAAEGSNPPAGWGFALGIGAGALGNYEKDMGAFQSYKGTGGLPGTPIDTTRTELDPAWLNFSLSLAIHLYAGLYVVPDVIYSHTEVTTTAQGFEAAPSVRGVSLFQYGGGLRYYFLQSAPIALFVQPSIRVVSASSSVNGFPVNPTGPAKELKGGLEYCWRNTRLGLEAGYGSISVKPPIDPAYVAKYSTPTSALGGNYGGWFGALTGGAWW